VKVAQELYYRLWNIIFRCGILW